MASKFSCRYAFERAGEAVNGVPVLRVGETIAGKVTVTAPDEIKLNALTVALVWMAHGKGNTDSIELGKVDTGIKLLEAGRSKELTFSFTVPENGPVSYEGEYVKISWSIRVYLDIPWAIDDQDDFPLLVRPRED